MRNAENNRRWALERIVQEKAERTDDTRQSEYGTGELVMLKVFKRTKLNPPYRGPFVVLGCASPNYVLEIKGQPKIYRVAHLERFLKRRQLDDVLDTRLPEPEDTVDGGSEDEDEEVGPVTEHSVIEDSLSEESRNESVDEIVEEPSAQQPGDSREDVQVAPEGAGRLGFLNPVFQFLPETTHSGREVVKNPKYNE